jgi:hypothetical protein
LAGAAHGGRPGTLVGGRSLDRAAWPGFLFPPHLMIFFGLARVPTVGHLDEREGARGGFFPPAIRLPSPAPTSGARSVAMSFANDMAQ